MSLTASNKVRHGKMLESIMNMYGKTNTGRNLLMKTWRWGALGSRLGTMRSADGVVVDLPHSKAPGGKNVVAKFIFASTQADLNRARQEYDIGKMMSIANIGPKVYAYYEVDIPTNMNLNNMFKKASGNSNSSNLFQYNVNVKNFKYCVIIIMENLYKNKGVVDTYSVSDGFDNYKVIPFQKIRNLINKMHYLGIIHADMHPHNVMVQKIKGVFGFTYRPVIIDFGRSLKTNKTFKSNENANAFASQGRFKNERWWYPNNGEGLPVLLNGNAWKNIKWYQNFKNENKPSKPTIKNRIKKFFKRK